MGCTSGKSENFIEENFSFKTLEPVKEIQISPNRKYIAIGYGWKRIKIIDYDRRYDIADFDGNCYNPFDRLKIDMVFS